MGWKKGSDDTKYKQSRDPNDGSWKVERINIEKETGKHGHEWIKGSTEGEIKMGIVGPNAPRDSK